MMVTIVYRKLFPAFLVGLCSIASVAPRAWAHFPWLDVNEGGRPLVFFGESPADRTYHLPPALSDWSMTSLDSDGHSKQVDLTAVTEDDFVGLRGDQKSENVTSLSGTDVYGVYHGSKLVYYSQYLAALPSGGWATPPDDQALRASVSRQNDDLLVTVRWNKGRLQDSEVQLIGADGERLAKSETDSKGVARFEQVDLPTGLCALLVGWTDEDASGVLGEDSYGQTMHYLTVTFPAEASSQADQPSTETVSSVGDVQMRPSGYPDLPMDLTSFGGAIAGGQLFVYGGHSGMAHQYSSDAQSETLWSLDLGQPEQAVWRKAATGPKVQGLAMVPHDQSVVRLGGLMARNAEEEEHDLHSQASVARYDTSTGQWADLTSLPEPRSSHAAAVLGDRVFVIGGWSMAGDADPDWHQTAWWADLTEQPIRWQATAPVPFQRRALSVAAHAGKIYAVGGMDAEDGPSTRVDVYDPETDRWADAPSLIGPPITGFGCWAHSIDGRLYVSTVSGTIQRLVEDEDRWEVVGTYEPGRFFHCMLPLDNQRLLMVGGANMQVGRFRDLAVVEVR